MGTGSGLGLPDRINFLMKKTGIPLRSAASSLAPPASLRLLDDTGAGSCSYLLELRNLVSRTAGDAEAVVVAPVARVVEVPVRDGAVVREVVPGAAADVAEGADLIPAPLPNITAHVIQSKLVRRLLRHRPSPATT